MNSSFAAEGVWIPLDYEVAWAPFARFQFEADFYETERAAIALPEEALVIDLAPVFDHEGATFAAGKAAINATALRAFVSLAGELRDDGLYWQHTPYRYSPSRHALAELAEWPIPVFPDGDYYIHLGLGAVWGTFGHPWQQSLTLWGQGLLDSLGAELLRWLPRHAQSRA